ncbi:MAG: CsbD family protein [Actinobacteria bacterium]|nr:CsbD family protein [Planctomycetota bacterium]MCB0973060.1 CsbD family protein [Actinomycetota bacterium]MCB9390867.1 CsbD family protein [Acidimicrobiia bacterium]
MGENSDKIVGRVKQAAGDLTNDDDLKKEGESQENAGVVKGKIDEAADKLDGLVDKVRNKID